MAAYQAQGNYPMNGPVEIRVTGLDVPAESTLTAAQSDGNKLRLRDQTEQAQRAGVFGAPTFISADGELFWGNDRLERALLWAKQIS